MTDAPQHSPQLPTEPDLDPDDPKTQLQLRLRTVLLGLPSFFEFNNHIAGVEATDLFALNTLLGASIEGQVVKALNQQRALWDPYDEWLGYVFVRQSQRFPDVLLTKKGGAEGPAIALGIELKGWFLLAKEGVPSFRFQTTPAACAPHDLLVVVPWYLDNVLSGSPVAAEPFVVSARWAAEYRNYWWSHLRRTKDDSSITSPAAAKPYPSSDAQIVDSPARDGGGNFGRLARVTGLMDNFVGQSNGLDVLGIRILDWFMFLRAHSDQADRAEVTSKVFQTYFKLSGAKSDVRAQRVAAALTELAEALGAD
ncbi:hypothetical protein [uncultured Friedmanniella sp.]|uniref:hypothetical protein n=1 Tax=uncultured Friedmanniella sp. TaxID=335381 RepID=UPI0035CA512C